METSPRDVNLEEVFSLFDTDNDGLVSKQDLFTILKETGVAEEEVQEFLQSFLSSPPQSTLIHSPPSPTSATTTTSPRELQVDFRQFVEAIYKFRSSGSGRDSSLLLSLSSRSRSSSRSSSSLGVFPF